MPIPVRVSHILTGAIRKVSPPERPPRPRLPAAVLAALVCLPLLQSAQSTMYHVPADFSTIQAAIDSATHGDEIIVATGTYRESLEFKGKDIILRSSNPDDPEVVRSTILMPSRTTPGDFNETLVILFSGKESDACVLAGFTITGGKVSLYSLGGAIVGRYTCAEINKNIIHDNGGTLIEACNGPIRNNLIYDNYGPLHNCHGFIFNNLISGNYGGLLNCDGYIANNTIIFNNRSNTNPLPGLKDCRATIRNNIIWGNGKTPAQNIVDSATPSYCCIESWTGRGEGNIFTDPRFVDPEAGDFRLRSDSYCIDSGGYVADVTGDIEGTPRPFDAATEPRGDGSDIDIGAYEFVGNVRSNQVPHQPSNLSPPDGATNQLPILTLVASEFIDADTSDLFSGSQWQVDDDVDFSSPEYDSGALPGTKTDWKVPAKHLYFSTTYWWRVRYMDHLYGWSEWSVPTRFSTLEVEGTIVPEDYATIQEAIDAAPEGGIVIVSPGTYFENVHFHGKNLTLRSLDPENADLVSQTVIDANGDGAGITFSGTEKPECVVSGLTVTNGKASPLGAITGNGSHATIEYCRIVDNEDVGIFSCSGSIRKNFISGNSSGGFYECWATIESNVISGNGSSLGGGLRDCDGVIRRNIIAGNGACYRASEYAYEGWGGGLYGCDGLVESNLIYDNGACSAGGGMAGCHGTIQNNTFYDNLVFSNEGGNSIAYCTGIITNCIMVSSSGVGANKHLFESSTPTYSCIENWTLGGQGNISRNPEFVDPENDDFHLLPGSPCIDAGKYAKDWRSEGLDFEGNPRGFDGTSIRRGDGSDFDMGAIEYQGPFVLGADFNGSESVDYLDLYVFQDDWKEITTPSSLTDITDDGIIDARDLFILLVDWKRVTEAR